MVVVGDQNLLKNIVLYLLLLGCPTVSIGAETRTLEIEFSFTTPNDPAKQLLGYRLYKEGEQVCDSNDHYTNKITCDIFTEDGIFNFTLTAYFFDGSESPPSPFFPFVIGSTNANRPNEQPELTQTQVSQLYVSIFGRASEGEGNSYWSSKQDDMTTAANTMLNTEVAKAYLGEALYDDQMFIEFIYKNTLGKTYAEDPTGVDYWVHELAAGKSKGQVVATLINAAIGPQYAGLPAQDQFLNKVTVSNYTADTITTVPDVMDLSAFVSFITGVTDDPATVAAAKAAIDAF
jgi:hypothetical protein